MRCKGSVIQGIWHRLGYCLDYLWNRRVRVSVCVVFFFWFFFLFVCFFSEVFGIYCFEQDAVRMKSQPAYQKYSETSIEVVGYCCSEKCSALF